MKQKKAVGRIEYFDIAKGIGMICIMMGHLGKISINQAVYTFHIPLFLLISGYFMSRKTSFGAFVKQKGRALLMPYVITSLFLVVLNIPYHLIKRSPDLILRDMLFTVLQALYGSGTDANKTLFGIQSIGAIWFFMALFWAFLVVRWALDVKCGGLYVFIIALIAYFTSKIVWLPFSIQAGGVAAIFVYCGNKWREKQYFDEIKWLMFILGILFYAVERHWGIYINIVCNEIRHAPISIIGAICISYTVIIFSKLLAKCSTLKRIFSFYGKNSMIILCLHLIETNYMHWSDLAMHLGLQKYSPNMVYLIIFSWKIVFVTVFTILVLKVKSLHKNNLNIQTS